MIHEDLVLVEGKYLPILATATVASANGAQVVITGKKRTKMRIVALVSNVVTTVTFGEAAHATGYIQLAGLPADTNTVTIDDGSNPASVFEFDNTGAVTGGNVSVTIGATVQLTLEALATAINGVGAGLVVTAVGIDPVYKRVYLRHDNSGTDGNASITKSGTNISVSGMSGGAAATTNKLTLAATASAMVCLPLFAAGWVNGGDGSDITITATTTTTFMTAYYVEIPVPFSP